MPLRNDVHLAQRPELLWLCWFPLGDVGDMTPKGVAFPIRGVETGTASPVTYFDSQVNDKLMFQTRAQQAFAVRGQIPNIFRLGGHTVAVSANRFCSYSRNTPVHMERAYQRARGTFFTDTHGARHLAGKGHSVLRPI